MSIFTKIKDKVKNRVNEIGNFVSTFNLKKEIEKSYILGKGKAPTPQEQLDIAMGFAGGTSGAIKKVVPKIISKIIPEIKPVISVVEKIINKVEPVLSKERKFITSVKEELPILKVSGQYIPRSTDTLAIKAKNLIKDTPEIAEKFVRENLAKSMVDDKTIATGSELLKHYTDKAALETDVIIKNTLYEKASSLANDMAEKLTELGRSVQAASILGRLTPEGQVKFAARTIQKYNEVIDKGKNLFGLQKKIPELTPQQTEDIVSKMKSIDLIPDGIEKAIAFKKLQNYISGLVPTPLFKKIVQVWKAGLLTGVKTSGLNIMSNLSHTISETAKDIPATIVDKAVSLFTGTRTTAFTTKGVGTGTKEGFSKGLRYLQTGFDERNIGTKLDYHNVNMGKGKLAQGLQKYTDTVFRVLGSEDQPFYYASKLRSMYEQAKVTAINKGLKGKEAQTFIDDLIQNPTEQMIKYASLDAETVVFQNPTALGKAAGVIQKIGGGAGELIVPFGKTPSAVATQILNYSPVGFVKTILENIGKGKFDQRLFSKGLGRAITGTGAMALGLSLFKKDFISLSRPKDEREQKLWELEGRKANSIYDPLTKKWRSIQVLGPVGNIILMGGYLQKSLEEKGSITEAMATTLAGATQSLTEQTFLTGINNFLEALRDPARSAQSVVNSTLSSTIPTLISDISRTTDTRERRAATLIEKLQSRIPGLRNSLEPQVTVLGDELKTIGNPIEVMVDPSRPSPKVSTPLIDEFRRLDNLGFKASPTLLGDKNGYKGLTKEQNTALWKKAGEITNEKLNNLIQNQQYQQLPDEEKSKLIQAFTDKAKLTARVGMTIELTDGLSGDILKAKLSELKKSGFLTNEVFNRYVELR